MLVWPMFARNRQSATACGDATILGQGRAVTARSSEVLRRRTDHSRVSCELRDGRAVYVKHYADGGWDSTRDTVRKRAVREADLMGRLSLGPGFHGRLGSVRLVKFDADGPTLVSEAVNGRPLNECLGEGYGSRADRERLRALYLAGKWLRVFQALPMRPGDEVIIGRSDPDDLVEYCDIRMRTLQDLGYTWLTDALRRRVRQHVGQLVERSPEGDRRRVWCHHDYALANVLWDGTTLTAIDFGMAGLDVPLVDATYFLHRLEMLRVYFPWKRWPVGAWKRAFLRGYGRPDAPASPMYDALMVRHLLCRLQTYVRRPAENLKERLHHPWIRWCVRIKLVRAMSRGFSEQATVG
jgi:hypothetical protein